MKKFKRKKSLIALYMIILAVADIFATVLSGNMGGKYMSFSILILAVGFYADNAGKMERIAIEENEDEKNRLDTTQEKAASITLFIIQTACFVGAGLFGVLLAVLERYADVFTSLTMVFTAILTGSFIIEHILQTLIIKSEDEKNSKNS